MDAPPAASSGEVNGRSQQAQPSLEHGRKLYSIDEALQRTPLTSINPFDPEIIPLPQAISPSLSTNVLSNHELASGKAHLQHLDRVVQQPKDHFESQEASSRLDDLRWLLTTGDFTQYQFPPLALPRLNGSESQQKTATTETRNTKPPSKIGAFAEKLIETGVFQSSFRYPTPSSRKTSPTARNPSPQRIRRTSTHLTPQHANQRATLKNAQAPPAPVTPSRSPSIKSSASTPMVMIRPPSREIAQSTPHDSRTDEELLRQLQDQKIKKEEAATKASKQANEILRSVDVDLQERAEAAVGAFEQTLMPVLDAEERLDVETSPSQHALQHFEQSADGATYFVNNAALLRIDSVLAKAVSMSQVLKVPLELLMRSQKLCAKVVDVAINEDFPFPEDSSEDAMQRYVALVRAADNGTAASRTALRTMTAGRLDRELFSERVLEQLLKFFRQIVEGCIIPIVETKASSDVGRSITEDRTLVSTLTTILQRAGRILKLLGDLLLTSELSESTSTSIDFICTSLVFVSNASSEKDSILGVQKFEGLRRSAMDCLARVFLRTPSQRQSILDEILSSLEKLPVARQSARHYKVIDGKPIQLVSALIMQLVQTTATFIPTKQRRPKLVKKVQESTEQSEEESDSDASPTKRKSVPQKGPNGTQHKHTGNDPIDGLAVVGKPLWANVQKTANHVAHFLVRRALTSTKTSEEPYRNLLDIFTEDFVSVLGHVDWPAAELILQSLLRNLIGVAEGDKSGAPAKNMALDLMGVMGSGIADLKSHFNHLVLSISSDDDLTAQRLARLCHEFQEHQLSETELTSLKGPYGFVTNFLGYQADDDVQLHNARNYQLLHWSQCLWTRGQSPATPMSDDKDPFMQVQPSDDLARWLLKQIQEPAQSKTDGFEQTPTSVARTASVLLTMQMTFCRAIVRLSNILLRSLASPHATSRSRGLKSVVQVLEKDPSMLDSNPNFVKHIGNAAMDSSTMVRDAALQLMGKCIALRPQVELDFLDTMLSSTSDPTIGIRKRAIRLLKEAYLRNRDDQIRVDIASSLLKRVNDTEQPVTDLARQTLEDIWIDPYPLINRDIPLALRQGLTRHASQLVTIAEQSDNVLQAFEPFFRSLLSVNHKNSTNNRRVCRAIASAAFDNFIENDQKRNVDARANILVLLSVLVRAQPELLALDQLKMLETYVSTLTTGADLRLYKPVAQIYNAAMPCFVTNEHDFINRLQTHMIGSLTKIPSSDLMAEVTDCLWAMQKVLRNKSKLTSIAQQLLNKLDKDRHAPPANVVKWIRMIGHFGRSWNLDESGAAFKKNFQWWSGEHVYDLFASMLLPSGEANAPVDVRRSALESLCLIGLSWPGTYMRDDVLKSLESALRSGDENLEKVVVCGLRDFFNASERQTRPATQTNGTVTNGDTVEKFGTSMVSSDTDKAGMQLASRFFNDVEKIALKHTNDAALAATELICSTSRQGVVHPRQTGCILVALETSPNQAIATAAFAEHMSLHSKHESILEKEYVKAVELAYTYQRDTVKDNLGLNLQPTVSAKLASFFEVLKTASVTARKRLFPNLCKRLDVTVSKLDSYAKLESHHLFAKFVCQNLAFGIYTRVEEVVFICTTLEAIFSTTGNALSQRLEPLLQSQSELTSTPEEMASLTVIAALLTLLWRTRCQLRQIYTNIPSSTGKSDKRLSKDTTKAPIKSPHALKFEESFLKNTETAGFLMDGDAMRDQCKTFLDLLSVDHEARVVNSSDEQDPGTPDDDRSTGTGTPSLPPSGDPGRPRKRRRSESGSAASTPSGKKRGRPRLDKRKSSGGARKMDGDDEDGGWD